MNNKIIMASALVALLGTSGAAHAATTQGSAKATILAPVTVTKSKDLEFGKIVVGTTASTVTIGANGTNVCGTGLTCLGTQQAAQFTVAGAAGDTVSVQSVPSVILSDGTNSMTATLSTSANTLTLTGGTAAFNVGGVLSVAGSQAAGAYQGQFDVTVNYQ